MCMSDPDLRIVHQGVDPFSVLLDLIALITTQHRKQPDPDLRIVHQGVDNILSSGGYDSPHYYTHQSTVAPPTALKEQGAPAC